MQRRNRTQTFFYRHPVNISSSARTKARWCQWASRSSLFDGQRILTHKRGRWTPIREVSPEHCRGNSAGVGRTRCASAASSRRCWSAVCSRCCRASSPPRPRSAARRLGSIPWRPPPAPRSPPSASSRPAARDTRRRCGISAPCWRCCCRHGDPLVLMLWFFRPCGSITARRWGSRSQ